MDAKQLPHELCVPFWIKRGCGGGTTKKLWWTMKNTQRPRNPNADLGSRKVNTYNRGSSAEVAAVLWTDSGWCSGQGWRRRGALRWRQSSGSSRVARGRRRREGRMRKDQVVPIDKGISEQAGAKIEEDPNNDYPTKRTPRFSEDI